MLRFIVARHKPRVGHDLAIEKNLKLRQAVKSSVVNGAISFKFDRALAELDRQVRIGVHSKTCHEAGPVTLPVNHHRHLTAECPSYAHISDFARAVSKVKLS